MKTVIRVERKSPCYTHLRKINLKKLVFKRISYTALCFQLSYWDLHWQRREKVSSQNKPCKKTQTQWNSPFGCLFSEIHSKQMALCKIALTIKSFVWSSWATKHTHTCNMINIFTNVNLWVYFSQYSVVVHLHLSRSEIRLEKLCNFMSFN